MSISPGVLVDRLNNNKVKYFLEISKSTFKKNRKFSMICVSLVDCLSQYHFTAENHALSDLFRYLNNRGSIGRYQDYIIV